jgi:GntR family transcriptional regulator, galactonate operon transcriptional repressor
MNMQAQQNISDVQEFGRSSALNSDRLFGQVAQLLGTAIVAGTYKAGDLLPNEDALRSEISVSRTAYREAVKFLTAKGMIEARPKSGTRVAPRDHWNLIDPDVLTWHLAVDPNEQFIRNLFELRRMVEPRTARLAAQRRTPEQMAAIELAMQVLESGKPYSDATIRADLDFHHAIFQAAGNPVLTCMSHVVVATIQWSMLLQATKNEQGFLTARQDHRRVCDAIMARDGEMAEAMMGTLVIDALNDTLDELVRRKKENAAKIG